MIPDSVMANHSQRAVGVKRTASVRTVLGDGNDAFFDLPTGAADSRQRLQDLNRLTAVDLCQDAY